MHLKPTKTAPFAITAAVILLVCLARWGGFGEYLERITYDARVRWAANVSRPPTNLGFVFIDEASIRAVQDRSLGYSFGLYWPRQVYGRLVQELHDQGARAVAMDVLFGQLRPDHSLVAMADGQFLESDDYFALQMNRAGNVLLAATEETLPPLLFRTNAARVADISTDLDSDGILRRVKAFRDYRLWHPVFRQLEADPEYGVDLRVARLEPGYVILPQANGEEIRIPLNANGEFELADFVGDKVPEGMAARGRPYAIQRTWHMGIELAARQLGLDLDQAEVDLARGRIVLRSQGGTERVLPVDRDGYFYINWTLAPDDDSLARRPAHLLLRQQRERLEGRTNTVDNTWQGRLVVVGSSAQGNDLTDRGATPLSKDALLVAKHWNVARSVLMGDFVRRTSVGTDLALISVLGVVAALLTFKARAEIGTLLIVALVAGYAASAVVLYIQTRWWLPLVLPGLGAILVTHACLVVWRIQFEQADKRRVREVFSTIVSPKIVHELLKAQQLELGGVRREISVLFADVRGFTSLTEASQEEAAERVRAEGLTGAAAEACFDEQARQTLRMINLYLGKIADQVTRHDGTFDKFIGDCVMAFWGAPAPNPRHATQCVQAAIDAQRAVDRLNRDRAAENQRRQRWNPDRIAAGQEPLPLLPLLSLGTGINTGMATVGLMGAGGARSVRQGSYTVFGREVNLAQRLESASGHGRIFISTTTWEHLRRDSPELAALCIAHEPIALKGLRQPVPVYEVAWLESERTSS